MDPDAALHLEIAAVVAVVLPIVALAVVASGGACTVHAANVESALGDITLMTYEQAATGNVKEEERCAICLSEYGEAGELVRVVPTCGHFFHAECRDMCLRKRRTCPLCRGRLWPPPLPGMPRPERPPMPPRRPPQ